jgi:hypothetical protein
VVFLAVIAFYCLRSESGSGRAYYPGSEIPLCSSKRPARWRTGADTENNSLHILPSIRDPSLVEAPHPSATIVKAHESLSFTGSGADADARDRFSSTFGTHAQGLEHIMNSMERASKGSQNLPEEHLGHRSFALWSGTNTSAEQSVSDRGMHMATLAASTVPRETSSVGSSAGQGAALQDTMGTESYNSTTQLAGPARASPASSWAPPGGAEFAPQHPGGTLSTDDLKIFSVLDRGRDSTVYQGTFFSFMLQDVHHRCRISSLAIAFASLLLHLN